MARAIFLLLVLPFCLSAQQLNIPLLQNFNVTDQALELQLNSDKAEQVLLGWQNSKGQQETHAVFLSPGTSLVDLSSFRTWKGQINFLVTNTNKVNATMTALTFGHKIAGFFQPNYLTPRSINMSEPFQFKGIKTNHLLLVLWLIFFLGTLLFKIDWRKGLFISFVAVWALQSLRLMKNEVDIFSKLKSDNYELSPFVELAAFTKEIKPLLKGQRWTKDQLSGVHNSYVKYHLWEEPFVNRKQAQPNDYLITTKPGNRSVVFQQGGFYLVQL